MDGEDGKIGWIVANDKWRMANNLCDPAYRIGRFARNFKLAIGSQQSAQINDHDTKTIYFKPQKLEARSSQLKACRKI